MSRNTVVGTLSCVTALSAPVAVVVTHNVFIGGALAVLALVISAFAE